jgi:hypothetical protein
VVFNQSLFGMKVHLVNATEAGLACLPRMVVAAVLVLALLSAVVPLRSASAAHLCTMECCAGLAPHAAGSCHMDLSAPGKAAPVVTAERGPDHCGPQDGKDEIDGIVAGVMGMKNRADSSPDLDDITIDVNEHCGKNSQSKDLSRPANDDHPQPASIATQSFSKPCPPECGAGALSSGVRPSRHAVALAFNARPRPPTLGRKGQYSDSSFLITSAYSRQLRPRGPPLACS